MRIRFDGVHLTTPMPRLDAPRGVAAQETSVFDTARMGVTIELDTATRLVRISKGSAVAYVPLKGVQRFGDVIASSPPRSALVFTNSVTPADAADGSIDVEFADARESVTSPSAEENER